METRRRAFGLYCMPSLKEKKIDTALKTGLTRGDFLKTMGVGLAALGGACDWRWPHAKAVPEIDRPEGVTPGVARWQASTCGGCSASCGALVKIRDGRPIKMEGLKKHPLSQGGLCARGQATLLDLYDSGRLKDPLLSGKKVSWADWDKAVVAKMKSLRGKQVRLVTQTLPNPSLNAAIAEFLNANPSIKHVVYDPISSSSILDAHQKTHGKRVLPHYQFAKAKAIVGFDADFLGTWISPVEFASDWAKGRVPTSGSPKMSRHIHFEPRVSLTGSNADLRVPIKPSEEYSTVASVAIRLAKILGTVVPHVGEVSTTASSESLDQAAQILAQHKKEGLVVSGSSDLSVQILVNWMNSVLGNYGNTLDIQKPSLVRSGSETGMEEFVKEAISGRIAGVIFVEANPVYDHPLGEELAKALSKMEMVVSLSNRLDETASHAPFVAADSHPLESWGDAEPVPGVITIVQPAIRPLFNSRPAMETLLALAGKTQSAYDFVRAYWKSHVFPKQKSSHNFDHFWDASLESGVASYEAPSLSHTSFSSAALAEVKNSRPKVKEGDFEFVAYSPINLYDGHQAFNPWLEELPDPVTRVSWENYVQFSPADAKRLGIVEGRMVRVSSGKKSFEIPAQIQLGMPEGVVAAALGYGRITADDIAANYPITKIKFFPVKIATLHTANVYPFLNSSLVSVAAGEKIHPLAKIQRYDFQRDPYLQDKRHALREETLEEYAKNASGGGSSSGADSGDGLWDKHEYPGHKWAMSVDLNRCSGCAACVIACQAENNIPTVGKSEVRKSRDMYWIRIDRYYSGSETNAPQNPTVAFQPMTCQQCDNAPCETVCPVAATTHSSEGINMQTYNRCVGTRYCENNCPYKVRRFNWFDYDRDDAVQDLVLNPDVTVRQRGVMEKCNFCYQRIRDVEITTQIENRKIHDGEVQPACVQSCPTQALVFGDINDSNSQVASKAVSTRVYRALEELGVKPSIYYQTKVRNVKS